MGILSWLKGRRSVELDENDFKEEIRAHLAIATQEKIADGADRTDAHYAALKEFGNVTRTTEAARSVWTPRWLEALRDLMSDVRYAIRALAKNPAFSFTVVGVLTLGIGLNAAVFTMLKGMALSPLAGVAKSGSLAVIFAETSAGRQLRVSYPDYQYLRDHDRAFSELFGSILGTANLGRGRGARQVWGEIVTGNYFKVLGVRAELGRTLLPSDEIAPGRHPVVVISDGSVAARLRRRSRHRRQDDRGQQQRADGRGCGGSRVPRHDRELRRRAVHSGDDGAAARLHLRKPADHAVRHPLRPSCRCLLSARLPAAGHHARARDRAGRCGLGRALA